MYIQSTSSQSSESCQVAQNTQQKSKALTVSLSTRGQAMLRVLSQCPCKRALSFRQTALYFRKSITLHGRGQGIHFDQAHTRVVSQYPRKRALYCQKSPVFLCKKTLYFRRRALHVCKRALYFRTGALYFIERIRASYGDVCAKEPSILAKEPCILLCML